jgi:hypothetical protein
MFPRNHFLSSSLSKFVVERSGSFLWGHPHHFGPPRRISWRMSREPVSHKGMCCLRSLERVSDSIGGALYRAGWCECELRRLLR